MEERPLSNTVGAVLDPVFSLRRRVRILPNETARVTFSTAIANTREEAVTLADKYHDPSIFERESRLARSEEHTSELQSLAYLVCRLLLEKKNINIAAALSYPASTSRERPSGCATQHRTITRLNSRPGYTPYSVSCRTNTTLTAADRRLLR